MTKLSLYASLVKLSHTIFALPFALVAFFYAVKFSVVTFDLLLLVKVLLCMVTARNSAMGFNRLVDRFFDAQNPRTARREIPIGAITVAKAKVFVFINLVCFILASFWINRLCGLLSPVAIFVILGYSYTKRFTWLCHLVLGIGLGIAPIGAYMAVTGEFSYFSLLLGCIVATWTAGFDIIYSLQDMEFDRGVGLHSVPAQFSLVKALWISRLLHLVTLCGVVVMGVYYLPLPIYYIGALIYASVLVYQHIIASKSKPEDMGANFALVNGFSSVVFSVFVIISIFI